MAKRYLILITLFLIIGGVLVCRASCPLKKTHLNKKSGLKESDYVNAYCRGIVEYKLPDGTRVDCLTNDYAIEFDYAKKWAESIGQSIYYAKMTGKKPAVAIIMKSPNDKVYTNRIKKVDLGIKIFEIKAENYNVR
jgi:hypothetical protein